MKYFENENVFEDFKKGNPAGICSKSHSLLEAEMLVAKLAQGQYI